MTEGGELKKTPLCEKHVALGARMVPFSGWLMPVQYTGILEEHLYTRSDVSIFDICHMGEFLLKGKTAESDVDRLVTCDVKGLNSGKCRYGFLLNEKGGVIDDLIVFKMADEEFMLVVNAGTIDKDSAWIRRHLSSGTVFEDISDKTGKIDVQGPLSQAAVSALLGSPHLAALNRFNFTKVKWEGADVIVSATGYTGEKGYELFLAADLAGKLWDKLLSSPKVKPAGLGARDSLRLEKGYSLYGHEIDDDHDPLEANLERFVVMGKDFIGKKALLERNKVSRRLLTGFICEGRRSAKNGFSVMDGGKAVGTVTSGVFSPCLKKGIGLFYINRELASVGQEVVLSDGKIEIKAVVARPPFVV